MAEQTTPEPATDPGHLLPADEWKRVQREARAIANAQKLKTQRSRDNRLRGLALPPKLSRPAFPSITGFVQAKYDGGARPGPPTFGVWHDAETPLTAGYALAIANYFTRCTNQTSAHFMLGPEAGYQLLDTSRIGWHCGNGNPRSIGVENCGYVSFTPAQWLTSDGTAQMRRGATLIQEIHAAHGIEPRWMTDPAEILACHHGEKVGGWITHDQASKIIGGSTHTDPMPTYPLQQLMALANGAPDPAPVEDDMPRFDLIRNKDNGLMVLAAPGIWRGLSNTSYVKLVASMKLVNSETPDLDLPSNEFTFVQSVYLSGVAASIDPKALAGEIVAALPSGGANVSETDLETALRNVLGSLNDPK